MGRLSSFHDVKSVKQQNRIYRVNLLFLLNQCIRSFSQDFKLVLSEYGLFIKEECNRSLWRKKNVYSRTRYITVVHVQLMRCLFTVKKKL